VDLIIHPTVYKIASIVQFVYPASLVLTFGIKVTYFCQAAGASRLAAILAKRAWRSLRVKVHLNGDAVCS
jgi:hypothetical protein